MRSFCSVTVNLNQNAVHLRVLGFRSIGEGPYLRLGLKCLDDYKTNVVGPGERKQTRQIPQSDHESSFCRQLSQCGADGLRRQNSIET